MNQSDLENANGLGALYFSFQLRGEASLVYLEGVTRS